MFELPSFSEFKKRVDAGDEKDRDALQEAIEQAIARLYKVEDYLRREQQKRGER